MEQSKTVKELIKDIEQKINPDIDDNTSQESMNTEPADEETYKVVILRSKNTPDYYIEAKPMRITNCLILNNYISRYKNHCKGKTKKHNNFYNIIMRNDVYLITLMENIKSMEIAHDFINDYVFENKTTCIDLKDNEPIVILDKINTIKVNPYTGEQKSKYSRTYTKENSHKYNREKCRDYYQRNREKRMEYSRQYYSGLKEKANPK